MQLFCQDRLGTNTPRNAEKRDRFEFLYCCCVGLGPRVLRPQDGGAAGPHNRPRAARWCVLARIESRKTRQRRFWRSRKRAFAKTGSGQTHERCAEKRAGFSFCRAFHARHAREVHQRRGADGSDRRALAAPALFDDAAANHAVSALGPAVPLRQQGPALLRPDVRRENNHPQLFFPMSASRLKTDHLPSQARDKKA
jgi:hypothetical protein